jgi:hypothetical protein
MKIHYLLHIGPKNMSDVTYRPLKAVVAAADRA